MPDGVLVEDGDVAVEGLQVQVAPMGGADVEGRTTVRQFRRQQPTEIVRSECADVQFGKVSSKLLPDLGQQGAPANGVMTSFVD
jgi:hypothetical protein